MKQGKKIVQNGRVFKRLVWFGGVPVTLKSPLTGRTRYRKRVRCRVTGRKLAVVS